MSSTTRDGVMLPGKGKLILTREILDQIDWLHDKVGRKEWCGILFYRYISGDISDPKTLVLQAEQLYLMDIGSEAYTDADIDIDSIIEMDDIFGRELKKGLIHTHHSMSAFFSGTDVDELYTNTPFHNYYLSLIVNFSGEYVARVAYMAKRTTTIEYKNVRDEQQSATSEKEIVAMIEMDIHWEVPEVAVPNYFPGRYDKIKQEKAAKVSTYGGGYFPGRTQYIGGASQAPEDSERPRYNWDAKDEHLYKESPKQAELPFITKGGNLKVGDKELRPFSVVEKEMKDKIRDWLANGIATFTKGSTSDTGIAGMLAYLKEYFDQEYNEPDYPFFVNQMQRSMEDFFHGSFPKFVSEIGTKTLDGYDGNDVATDFFTMFDAWEHYLDKMAELRQGRSNAPFEPDEIMAPLPKGELISTKKEDKKAKHKLNKRVK